MRCIFAAPFVVICLVAWTNAHAQVYRCTAANGSVSYQDRACASSQRQKILDIDAHAPPGHVPAPPLTTMSRPVASTPTKLLPPPPSPLPAMYECVGAVNGRAYLSAFVPRPYFAPVAMLGYPPQSLGEAYGPGHGVGTPVPVIKPDAGSARVASGMTQVQDACRPAPRKQVCDFVRHEYDENQHKLRMAMPSEQPPLEQRDRQLHDELRNCR